MGSIFSGPLTAVTIGYYPTRQVRISSLLVNENASAAEAAAVEGEAALRRCSHFHAPLSTLAIEHNFRAGHVQVLYVQGDARMAWAPTPRRGLRAGAGGGAAGGAAPRRAPRQLDGRPRALPGAAAEGRHSPRAAKPFSAPALVVLRQGRVYYLQQVLSHSKRLGKHFTQVKIR